MPEGMADPEVAVEPAWSRHSSSLAPLLLLAAVSIVASGATPPAAAASQAAGVTITYLYDNTAATPGTRADWGFACLVQGHGRTVLFDTGANSEILRHNLDALGVDASAIKAVVLSHDHGDHTAGLAALGSRPGLPVYYARGFNPAAVAAITATGARAVPVSAGVEVFSGFRTSDEFGFSIKEEALIVETPDGLVVLVGCSHPGIVSMLRQIRQSTGRPIHTVIGGFHLLQTPAAEVKRIVAAVQDLGVVEVGPTHCTGEEAIAAFKEAYGDHYIAGGVGTVVRVPLAGPAR